MGGLHEKLVEYGRSDFYPYHMPGHKRNMKGQPLEEYYNIDITEIDGFDNLHQADGILLESEKRINRLYGSDETFFLINGSTAGVLSAVSCVVETGGKILIVRNCHKSVYHAAYLRNCEIGYLYPKLSDRFEIAMGVSSEDVRQRLETEEGIAAVVITSPTYEGIISDVEKIVETVHNYRIPVIVDEAHGAHLGFSEKFPESAVSAGADLVIHSLHKTLPSPTQTALLHVSGNLVDRNRLRRYLSIYQSSSPSYPLMAGIELCFDIIEKDKEKLFNRMYEYWEEMLGKLEQCQVFRIMRRQDIVQEGMKDFDVGKLVISTIATKWSGQQLYNILLHKYHLQLEMAADSYVLAMFTIMDTKEGYERLTKAILELDRQAERESCITAKNAGVKNTCPEISCKLTEAMDGEKEWVNLMESRGRTAADFVNLYPPGIPVIVPGEIYDEEIISRIRDLRRHKLTIQGLNEKMEVICTAAGGRTRS